MTDTRLLIVDDSALYRQTISNVVRQFSGVSVVGVAKNGHDALEKIQALDPDLLTLDVQMPDMDGIGLLREIKRRGLRPKAIMVSSLTAEGAQVTTDALIEGAFDFILKPTGSDANGNLERLRDALTEKIDAFRQGHRRRIQAARRRDVPEAEGDIRRGGVQAVLIGTSTGGPAALKAVLPRLPASLPVPVLIVQHMPAKFTHSLARRLDEAGPLSVTEGVDGEAVRGGRAYVSPGGRHMRVERDGGCVRTRITDEPPLHGCRPAVDYLFESAADAYGDGALGIILTGMGRDGLAGSRVLKDRGARLIAQHEDDCVVYGMPKAIVESGLADKVVPLELMARNITRIVMRPSL